MEAALARLKQRGIDSEGGEIPREILDEVVKERHGGWTAHAKRVAAVGEDMIRNWQV
jgi:hypothetical protein